MHDTDAEGNEYFKCDFCRNAWAEDRQMVEGHRGSLICSQCLSMAYRVVLLQKSGVTVPEAVTCTLCIQHQESQHWQSPAYETAYACQRCINQSARILQKDPEAGWKIPTV
jgi:hypothetical protein